VEGIQEKEKIKGKRNAANRWSKPPPGWDKLNIEASYCDQTGKVVIRDVDRKVLLSACKYFNHMASAEEAEAAACLEGTHLALEWIRRPIMIESDCSELVKGLHSTDVRWASTIAEIKAVCQLLPECNIVHIRRDSNMVVDGLAQLARSSEQDIIMQFSVPPSIQDFHRDRNVVTSCTASTS
jgi:hypothetical protein